MNAKRIFTDLPKRHYATIDKAAAEAKKLAGQINDRQPLKYVIASGTDKDGNTRFFPVFLPNADQTHYAFPIVHHGFLCNPTPWWTALQQNIKPMQRRSRDLRDMLDKLVREGGSTGRHSALGMTLSFFITELEKRRLPYTLKAVPGLGYELTVATPEEREQWTRR